MNASSPIEHPRIAIVGLGFGAEFIPIYKLHPHAEMAAICQRNADSMNKVGDEHGVEKRYTDYQELLADPEIDAVHINTPIPHHAEATLQALRAGKHVACTVPMATSEEDCKAIVDLCQETGLHYMMMETVLYSREFLFMKQLYDSGELGKLQFLKASHQQDMDGWPGYWPGLPPMHYATHCVGPVLGLGRHEAEYVSCFPSGTIREEMHCYYNSPFAVETTHIKFANSDLSAQVYRSLFDVARQYRESIEDGSPIIELLRPGGTSKAYFAEFGYTPNTDLGELPGPNTPWSSTSDQLQGGGSVTLTWTNEKGIVFEREISLDEQYMFTIRDRVINNTGSEITITPYGRIARFERPPTENIFVLQLTD